MDSSAKQGGNPRKRIRAGESEAFECIKLQSLTDANVVRTTKARKNRSETGKQQGEDFVAAPQQSLEDELIASIRQGA